MHRRFIGRVLLLLALPALMGAKFAYERRFPSGDVRRWARSGTSVPQRPTTDPDLKPGFPVTSLDLPGTFHAGPAIHTLVGNIDADPELEILVTGLAVGPIYAWNHDGTPVPGWPVSTLPNAGYMTLGFMSDPPGRVGSSSAVVFSGHFGSGAGMGAFDGLGRIRDGWPRIASSYVDAPGTLVDIDGDGRDEVFVCEQDFRLHAYRTRDGLPLAGWPVQFPPIGGQTCHTPSVADLDRDGDLEIISATGSANGLLLLGYHHDGSPLAGFPVAFPAGYADTFAAIGDVDGDRRPEIVLAVSTSGMPITTLVHVVSADGTVERTMNAPRAYYGTAPALADLDGDGVPEIIVQTEQTLHVWKGDGTPLPGWPVDFGPDRFLGNSAPVVGDVTGDGSPDIVVTTSMVANMGEVRVYDRWGNLDPRFPKVLPLDRGAVPAIADLDLDGRNEIIVTADYWDGFIGYHDKVWAYDVNAPGQTSGPILWGQFMGGPSHQGRYPVTR